MAGCCRYESAPWLRQEGELAKQAIEADLPTLGICLGGQILAHVAGGEVRGKYGAVETGAEHLASWSDAALKEKGLDLVSIQERARAVDGENTQASQALALGFARQVQNFWGSENQLLSG